MVDYSKCYQFENDLGAWSVFAKTYEHPNDYGNGMLLKFEVEGPEKCFSYPHVFDIRYACDSTAEAVDALAMSLIEDVFGVQVCSDATA